MAAAAPPRFCLRGSERPKDPLRSPQPVPALLLPPEPERPRLQRQLLLVRQSYGFAPLSFLSPPRSAPGGVLLSHSLRSALRFGIREGRSGHRVDGVGALIPGDETFTEAGIPGAIGGAGLVRKAAEIGLEEAFLEVFARVPGHDFIA